MKRVHTIELLNMWNTCAGICALWVLQLIHRGGSLFSPTANGWSLMFKITCVICTYSYCLLSTFKCSPPFFFNSSVIFSSYSSLGMYISVSDQPTTNIVGPALMHVIMLQLLNCLPVNLFTSRLALHAHLWDSCPISPFSELRVSRAAGWNWSPHCFSCDMFVELAQIRQ